MKKISIISVLLAFCLVFACFFGCGGKDNATSGTDSADDVKQLDVIIISGQSNAVGFSPWGANMTKTYDDVEIFYTHEGAPLTVAAWMPVRSGLGINNTCFGPEMGMAEVLSARYKESGKNVAFIKYAQGGKAIWDFFLSPSSYSEGLGNIGAVNFYKDEIGDETCAQGYWDLFKTVKLGMEKLENRGFEPKIVGMVWMQGENDATEPTRAEAYDKTLANFIKDVRFDFENDNLPIVIGEIKSPDAMYEKTVIEAQKKVASETANCKLVNTEDLSMKSNDAWHFDKESMLTLGNRFAEALLELYTI